MAATRDEPHPDSAANAANAASAASTEGAAIPGIVLYSATRVGDETERQYLGRSSLRSLLLGMTPAEPSSPPVSLRKASAPRPAGFLWAVRQASGLDLVLRARDFPTAKTARRDARGILGRVAELQVTEVSDASTRRRGWWMSLDGQVVLVAGRPRPIAQRSDSDRDVRAALRQLEILARAERHRRDAR